MNPTVITIIVVVVILLLIAMWLISGYNNLVSLRNRVANAWSQIDIQLKQRADLIPNIVNTVKGYAQHESDVFIQVTQARTAVQAASNSGNLNERINAETQLDKAIVNVLAVAEAYPELKANANFMSLQSQLSDLEGKIAYARQFYNDVAQKLNITVESFPSNIIAGLFHFEKAAYFEVAEADRQVPQVQF
ncbi:LemA family protein [Alloscardovia theropitheci]|uniref:LemA family protein n=1 Tax=Alloscardovia theropitheci TaxID=2496842 RepID=A0A4R0QQR4_9BIFI|nr:LemA family protein [Alloscardovia theropitheci]TCD53668.1 LemA family protein [Alloscardovia theropitheci]